MRSGSIRQTGPVDLSTTLESAQSFLWNRTDGGMYDGVRSPNDDAWYYTVTGEDVLFVRQRSSDLEWRATIDARELLRERLRLDDDLDSIFANFSDTSPLTEARDRFPGLRVVRDPFFPCLITFICSSRTTVSRIHGFQRDLSRAFGSAVTVEGTTYHAFPDPRELAEASEPDLRDLGLGFRASYVVETTRMVASEELTVEDFRNDSYHEAHERLQSYMGVGPKVADCVCLFALDHLEAVPIDTWTRQVLERYYPDIVSDSYEATAEAYRERFGEYAGYAQTYLYHYGRTALELD